MVTVGRSRVMRISALRSAGPRCGRRCGPASVVEAGTGGLRGGGEVAGDHVEEGGVFAVLVTVGVVRERGPEGAEAGLREGGAGRVEDGGGEGGGGGDAAGGRAVAVVGVTVSPRMRSKWVVVFMGCSFGSLPLGVRTP